MKPQSTIRKAGLAFFFFFSIHFQVSAQSPTLTAVVNGERHRLPVIYLPDLQHFPFVGIHDLAEILNLKTYYSEKARKVILYFGDTEVKVTAMNPFISVGNRMVQLPIEARYADGDIYVPLDFFLDLIKPLFNGTITIYETPTLTAQAVKPDTPPSPSNAMESAADVSSTAADVQSATAAVPNILGVGIEEKKNGTLIRIKCARAFESSHINTRISRGWLYVDIYGGRVDTSTFTRSQPQGIIQKIVPVQLSQMAQISFKLKGEITSRKVYTDFDNREILVSLATKERVSEDILRSLESEKQKWLIDTIIIDPGHGGRDPGAIGPTGVREKDVTLAIARYLKKYLKKHSKVRVILTREDDRFVPLKDRTRLANQEQGKLFISIHANSNRSPRVRGLTTYFLGPAKTEEALEVSKRENVVINYEQDHSAYADFDAESFILLALAQNAYQYESQELAAMVQEAISRKTRIRNRGVKQAGFYVLIGASMPNILIEVAFLSNRKEERLLKSPSFQRKVAEAIGESILKFKQKYEKEI